MSNSPEGYIYAWQHICETYVQDDAFVIPGGLCEIRTIKWEEYYLSDIYMDKLAPADEERRQEEQLKQLEEELNRYEEAAAASIMTVGQKIEEYQRKINDFNTEDFGEYSASIFTDAIEINGVPAPTAYPTKGSHPRVLFT